MSSPWFWLGAAFTLMALLVLYAAGCFRRPAPPTVFRGSVLPIFWAQCRCGALGPLAESERQALDRAVWSALWHPRLGCPRCEGLPLARLQAWLRRLRRPPAAPLTTHPRTGWERPTEKP